MVTRVRLHEHVFIKPISVCTTYMKLARDTGLVISEENASSTKEIAKRIARFISSTIAIIIFTPPFVFFNTLCFTLKGSIALLTHILDKPLFNHNHNEYVNDMNLHIAYAIRELANFFFVGLFCLIYTFDPCILEKTDDFTTNTIEFLAVTEPRLLAPLVP